MKKFEDFTKEDLQELRNQIVLNSLYVSDYSNTMGISAESACSFFDGYVDYIWELAEEDCKEKGVEFDSDDVENIFDNYDNIETLTEWFYCFDDFSWVKYDDEDNDDE